MAKKAKKSKRFKYKLETLLRVRGIREREAQDEFKEAEEALKREQQKEEELRESQRIEYAALHELMSSGNISDLDMIKLRKYHLEVLKEKVEAQVKIRIEAEEEVEKAREKLIQKVKEKKIIEKDKENQRELWRKLMDKEEGKFLDDLSSVKYAKKDLDH